jgi:hypothetical protein
MTKGYHTKSKKTPQDVTNVEVILFNHLIKGGKSKQSNGKEKTEQWKEQTEQWKGF